MLSLFKRKKKMTLKEIHELYLVLESSIPKRDEELLIDEMMKILEKISPNDFAKAYRLLVGRPIETGSIGEGALFIRKLKEQDFFGYVAIMRGINGSRSDRTDKS